MSKHKLVVVLAGGGSAGIGWMSGVAVGLKEQGVDLAAADQFVGTSAGSIVGSWLAHGQDVAELAAPPAAAPTNLEHDPDWLAKMFRILARNPGDPAAARRAVGEYARSAKTADVQAQLDRISQLLPSFDFPAKLHVTTVDTDSGDLTVFTAGSGAPLIEAVAASCAVPGVYPAIPIENGVYMDGGIRTDTNADLAEPTHTLVVLQPLAHLVAPTLVQDEIRRVDVDHPLLVTPDEAARTAIGDDPLSIASWAPAHQAGIVQGRGLAAGLAHLAG